MFYWLIKIIAFIPFWICYPAIIKGKLPKGKLVIVANHRSNVDPLLLLANVWRNQHIVAKDNLFKNWFTRLIFRGMKAIPINREKVEISTIKECLNVLKKDETLTIFPEGTRNKTDEPLLEIKNGAGMIAGKANAPIVPVWIDRKPRLFRLTKIYVGEPFYISRDQINDSGNIIREKLLETKELYKKNKISK